MVDVSHQGNANHFTPTRMAIIKRTDITSVSEDVEKVKLSHIADRNIKWVL